jgi:hypothetical protein
MDLQEAIRRGRFLFNGAPKRLEVFKFVNGIKNTKDIARKTGKSLISTLNDLKKMEDMGLIKPKIDSSGKQLKRDKSLVFEKHPLVNSIPIKYFEEQEIGQRKIKATIIKNKSNKSVLSAVNVPSENQILDICRNGEDQLYEFKQSGVETEKITREIGAFLNTKHGGILFYGIDDSGTISGSDKTRQSFDQSIQNSIKHNIAPAPVIKIISKNIMGQNIILIIIPPWDTKRVYHFKEKVLIRKGTNVFGVTPEESKNLHKGKYII